MDSKTELINCGRTLVGRELVWGHSGNISIKTSDDEFLISAGGTALGNLVHEELVPCRINNESWEGTLKPSMETGLHRRIYLACSEIKAIVHTHPFYSTLAACSDLEIKTDFLPESMIHLGRVIRVPYYHAGSVELANAVAEAAKSSKVLLLNNHGIVCCGSSLDECVLMTEVMEFLSRLIITARGSGITLNSLGEEKMLGFLQHLRNIGRL